jgi:hypothetical protein
MLAVAVATLTSIEHVNAQSTITTCNSGFFGKDMAIRKSAPNDAFISARRVVKHVSSVSPGAGSCTFGPLLSDIALGAGVGDSLGIALDKSGNLFVSAGSGEFTITNILKIAPPYTSAATIFYAGAINLRSLAIKDNILYAADFAAGTILRFDLRVGPSSVTTFAAVPGVFGIFAPGVDNLFVTSNGGFNGISFGVGSNDIKHVTSDGVSTIATGLSFPEGFGGEQENLYIAAGGVLYTVPTTGGTPSVYAASPILFSHGVTVWKGGGYVTDSHVPGEVHKFRLLDD